ncbi:uncharacterized protein LOC131226481 [Magnolia sinica]|uniref:uncharacterized protein LOC131226481 n=1 Tax=Magnolia sinica TaxID=86752 RepID=UPI00265A28C3|nr:uncharacterized protein LOC131226481 [Magnolia sinica]
MTIANRKVYRILLDIGSLADILYFEAFDKIEIDRSHLPPIQTLLRGFVGDKVIFKGVIPLRVIAREGQNQVTLMVDFLVVNCPSTYNVILRRPSLNSMMAVVSTYHLMMKLPTIGGVSYLRGDQCEARHCYSVALRKGIPKQALMIKSLDPREELLEKGSPMEELITIPLDENDPSKTVQVETSLDPDHRVQMINFLRQNKDIFTWKWRVCVDYSDMNKACPVDSFPLPKIDQLVDNTAGHKLLMFMDAYSGYNQIAMHSSNKQKTTFFTDKGLYSYKVIPFGLKNARTTYQ